MDIIIGVTATTGLCKIHVRCKYVMRSSKVSQKLGALIVRYNQKKESISFVFFCFKNLSIAITLEPLVPSRWSFQLNVPHLYQQQIATSSSLILAVDSYFNTCISSRQLLHQHSCYFINTRISSRQLLQHSYQQQKATSTLLSAVDSYFINICISSR